MLLKIVFLGFIVQFLTAVGLEVPTCEYKAWKIPYGDILDEVANTKSPENCCTSCVEKDSCSAYSYNIISQNCLLWNYSSIDDHPDPNVISGIVLPPGWTTEVPIETTQKLPMCPENNTDPNVKYPHPYLCTKYFVCLEGVLLEQSCWDEWQFLYDYLEKRCRNPDDAQCYPTAIRPPTGPPLSSTAGPSTTESTVVPTTRIPVECPSTGQINIPHPDDCSKYISCDEGYPVGKQCDGGQLFDVVSLECVDAAEAICFSPPDATTTSSPSVTTSIPTTIPTSVGTGPTTPSISTAPTSALPSSSRLPPGECPEVGVVLIPHPEDCSKYISCDEGYPIGKQCDGGQLFDSVSLQCVAAADAICFNPPVATATSSPSSTPSTSITTPIPTTIVTTQTVPTTPAITTVPSSTLLTSTKLPPGECPETGTVNIPHPSDCSKYIYCDEGYPMGKQCDGGFLFDSITLECTLSDIATCFQQKQ